MECGVMPKEMISGEHGRYEVRVGWMNDSHLQVGVEEKAGFSLVTALYGDPEACERLGAEVCNRMGHRIDAQTTDEKQAALTALGRDVLNWVEGSVSNPDGSYTGVWVTLSRPGVNRLIRVLRRARDAVYGRDE